MNLYANLHSVSWLSYCDLISFSEADVSTTSLRYHVTYLLSLTPSQSNCVYLCMSWTAITTGRRVSCSRWSSKNEQSALCVAPPFCGDVNKSGKAIPMNKILMREVAHSSILWHTRAYSGTHTGKQWHTLAYSGTHWHTVARTGIQWHSLAYSEWYTLAYSGTFCQHTVAYTDTHT